MLLVTMIIGVYLFQYTLPVLKHSRRLLVLNLLLLTFIAVAKVMLPNAGIAYMYPVAALAMIIVTIIDVHVAFLLTTVIAFLAGYLAAANPEAIVLYLIFSGWTGALAVSKSQRINALLWACVYVGIVNTGIILIFNFSSLGFTSTGVLL